MSNNDHPSRRVIVVGTGQSHLEVTQEVIGKTHEDRLAEENQRLRRSLDAAQECCWAIDREQALLVPALKKAERERDALLAAMKSIIKRGLSITLTEEQLEQHEQLLASINRGHYRHGDTLIELGFAFNKDFIDFEDDSMFKKGLPVIAKQIPARAGKGPSFQAIHLKPEQREKLVIAMRSDEVKAATPFLQGDQDGWVMVEFWNRDEDLINQCCQILADSIKVSITPGDDFTRDELGLGA